MVTKTKKTEEKPKTEKKLPEIKLAANFKETGNIYMDMALSGGKGMPLGASILLFAPPGTGKTTIVADTIRSLLKKYEETRNIYMDMALSGGKGMPLGASILLFAPPGTGKTT